MGWIKWQIFKVCLRFNWNYTTTYKGRVWGTRRVAPPTDRLYFSGEVSDLVSFGGGGYTDVSNPPSNPSSGDK